MKTRFVSRVVVSVLVGISGLWGADIFVSPSGSDFADGTLGSPVATLSAARNKAEQLVAGNSPVTVHLRGGTFYGSKMRPDEASPGIVQRQDARPAHQ